MCKNERCNTFGCNQAEPFQDLHQACACLRGQIGNRCAHQLQTCSCHSLVLYPCWLVQLYPALPNLTPGPRDASCTQPNTAPYSTNTSLPCRSVWMDLASLQSLPHLSSAASSSSSELMSARPPPPAAAAAAVLLCGSSTDLKALLLPAGLHSAAPLISTSSTSGWWARLAMMWAMYVSTCGQQYSSGGVQARAV